MHASTHHVAPSSDDSQDEAARALQTALDRRDNGGASGR
ncbi:hypothetical protein HNR61_000841 [Actinomadura namibiensis]|uniref:Uncharacterized protein n=1 Tax=Actinomadura namibiensis TaxID=182080 RepID=A0A7W3QJS8_ACTNM|nr:hypothetical protein [Actinomadura namibiensis]